MLCHFRTHYQTTQMTYSYTVVYNMTYLAECNSTCDQDTCFECLAEEINEVQRNISASGEVFEGGLEIDSDNTLPVPVGSIEDLSK